ncbi:MAG TPA: hypothetical protein VHZ76_09300 [Gammaproteobacteria bacterium]|jgi:hypothetical protein|nr:hypothetical protein [Gammaproteobacteria bacterium]
MQRLESENPFQKWTASQVEGHLEKGKVIEAKTTLTPESWSQYRKITQYDLIRNLETNQITIKIHATAKAREEGLFDQLSTTYKNKAKTVEEPVTKNTKFTVPVLHITVPYTEMNAVLKTANDCEDKFYKMTEQRLKRLPEAISDSAVSNLINSFKRILKK